MTDQPNIADMAAFGASEYACYRWPGEEDQALRAAFCEGAAHAVSHIELTQTEVDLIAACASAPAPRAPDDLDALCRDYAQRWFDDDWSSYDEDEKAELRIEAHRWIKCWSAVSSTETLVGWLLTWPDGERSFYSKSKPVPTRGQIITPIYGPALSSTERGPSDV